MNSEDKNLQTAEIERQEVAKQVDAVMKERECRLQRIRELTIIEDRERALESPRSSVASTSAATALVVTSGHSASGLGTQK